MEIILNVHQISCSVSNCYLISDGDDLTLIDTGLPRDEKKIIDYIIGIGRTLQDLKRIILTHSDGDHVGSLSTLKQLSAARVHASEIEAAAIAEGRMTRELKVGGPLKWVMRLTAPLFRAKPARVDEFLTDGQVLPVRGGLRVIATEGHTPGHISLFAPSEKILFTGDSIVSRDGQLRGSTGMNTWDQEKANASVRKQAMLGARIVCPGHGSVVIDATAKFPSV